MTEQEKAREDLRQYLKPGDTVYTVLRHCSRSGMSRTVDVFIFRDNSPLRMSWQVAKAIGFTYDRKHEGVKVGGCGMDVGFEVVYNLSHALFSEGFTCIGDHCPSNDHSNGDRNYTPHVHKSGGYALKHRWM